MIFMAFSSIINVLLENEKTTLRKKYPHSELFWSVFSHILTEYRETRSIQSKCGKIRTRITPNKDTFHEVQSFIEKLRRRKPAKQHKNTLASQAQKNKKIQKKSYNDKKHLFLKLFFLWKNINFGQKLSLENPSLYHFRVAGYLKAVIINQHTLLYKK